MPTQTIASPDMTGLARALYTVVGEVLDAAIRDAAARPGPRTQRAMEVAALAYDLIATEYELA